VQILFAGHTLDADAFGITDNNMHIARGVNCIQAHGYKAGSGSQTAKLNRLVGDSAIRGDPARTNGLPAPTRRSRSALQRSPG